MSGHDVIVVGGGPVGMGLAIELGQRGVRVGVIERHAEPQPIPKGQNLTQRTAEHFHAWGCEPELRAARVVPRDAGIGGVTCYGRLLSDYAVDFLNRAKVRDYYFAANERLPQYATEAVLRARAAEIPAVDLRHGWSCVGAAQDEGGATVEVEAREGGARETLRAAYAVGCDGSRSVVREAAGIGQTRSEHERPMALLVFRSPELHALLERFPGKAFYNVLHPDLDGWWQFFGRVDQGTTFFFHSPVPPGTTAETFDFAAHLHRIVGQPFALELDHVGFWEARVAVADAYCAGRLFVAGDAAHSHPPYGGYGINLGFEDARNLGWKLAARLQGWGGEALLDSYDAERRPVFASTARDFIERFIREDRKFLETYAPERNRAAFERAWFGRGEDTGEVSAWAPNYEGSPVVFGPEGGVTSAVGTHEHRARAGHHLSPLALSDGRNAYERLGAGFTLVALGAPSDQVAAFRTAAKAVGLPLAVVEDGPSGHYGAPLVLVRPDSYVAWAGERAEEAAAVLSRAAGLEKERVHEAG